MNRIVKFIVRVYRRIFVMPNRKILWQITDKIDTLQKTSKTLSEIKKQIKSCAQEQQSQEKKLIDSHSELYKLIASDVQERRTYNERRQKEQAEADACTQKQMTELRTQLESCAQKQSDHYQFAQNESAKQAAFIQQYLCELKELLHRQNHMLYVNGRELERLEQRQRNGPPAPIKLSVIIPVYNTEKYLSESICSIAQQDMDDFEVLCVDDGSTDRSPQILEEHSLRFPFIRVYHTANHGQGAARNLGLRHANGQYVCFVDSDDLIKPNVLRPLYDEISSRNLDVLYFDGETTYENPELELKFPGYKKSYNLSRSREYGTVCSGQEMFCVMKANGDYREMVMLQMYRRAFLQKYGLVFPEGMFHEDTVFDFACMMQAERVAHKKINAYTYRLRPNSTMTAPRTEMHVYSKFRCYLEIAKLSSELKLGSDAAAWAEKELQQLRSSTLWHYKNSELDITQCTEYFNASTRSLFEMIILSKK